jgi:hypothetical protein
MNSRHLLLLLGICSHSRPASAQATPELAAQAYGQALAANDWPAAARMMHPKALQQLRDLFAPLLTAPEGEALATQFFGVTSGAEFAAMPDTVMYSAFLKTVLNQQPGTAEALSTAVITPLGHVNGGADTVLVVGRISLSFQGITISQFEVVPYIWDKGRWWTLLKADFTNMAAMLRQALGNKDS